MDRGAQEVDKPQVESGRALLLGPDLQPPAHNTKGRTRQEREEWINITTIKTLQKARRSAWSRKGGSKRDRRGRPLPKEPKHDTCTCVAEVENQGLNWADMCGLVKSVLHPTQSLEKKEKQSINLKHTEDSPLLSLKPSEDSSMLCLEPIENSSLLSLKPAEDSSLLCFNPLESSLLSLDFEDSSEPNLILYNDKEAENMEVTHAETDEHTHKQSKKQKKGVQEWKLINLKQADSKAKIKTRRHNYRRKEPPAQGTKSLRSYLLKGKVVGGRATENAKDLEVGEGLGPAARGGSKLSDNNIHKQDPWDLKPDQDAP